jgi:hypothetical protein
LPVISALAVGLLYLRHRMLGVRASAFAFESGIEPQGCSILIVVHAREIVSRVNVSCAAKEELVECPEDTRTQRINNATKGDLDEKLLRVRNGYELEVPWEYPRPIGNEVVLRERCVHIAASDHLGKVAVHNADATWKVRCAALRR